MKQLAVVSGKGGTGKTSIIASFAALAEHTVIADCDVDAADLHLLLKPEPGTTRREDFYAGYVAVLNESLCIGCGVCVEKCRFDALEMAESEEGGQVARLIPYSCEGCGACVEVCPTDVFELRDQYSGELLRSQTRFGPLVHARLSIGQGASGKLVSMVRATAREAALKGEQELILIDCSPGIGCPVIASLSGVDAALIVTEPSVSGLHDLKRIAELCGYFKLPTSVVVNKFDIHEEMTHHIEKTCDGMGIEVIGRVAFDPVFVKALLAGKTVVEYDDGKAAEGIKVIWRKWLDALDGKS